MLCSQKHAKTIPINIASLVAYPTNVKPSSIYITRLINELGGSVKNVVPPLLAHEFAGANGQQPLQPPKHAKAQYIQRQLIHAQTLLTRFPSYTQQHWARDLASFEKKANPKTFRRNDTFNWHLAYVVIIWAFLSSCLLSNEGRGGMGDLGGWVWVWPWAAFWQFRRASFSPPPPRVQTPPSGDQKRCTSRTAV
jgi:hypothetical protein